MRNQTKRHQGAGPNEYGRRPIRSTGALLETWGTTDRAAEASRSPLETGPGEASATGSASDLVVQGVRRRAIVPCLPGAHRGLDRAPGASKPVGLVLVGTDYANNLTVPHNVAGWRGLKGIESLLKVPRRWSWLNPAMLLPVRDPRTLETKEEWDELIKDLKTKGVDQNTILFVVALHGGSDARGAYLMPNQMSGPEDALLLNHVIESMAQLPADKRKVLVLEGRNSRPTGGWGCSIIDSSRNSRAGARDPQGQEPVGAQRLRRGTTLLGLGGPGTDGLLSLPDRRPARPGRRPRCPALAGRPPQVRPEQRGELGLERPWRSPGTDSSPRIGSEQRRRESSRGQEGAPGHGRPSARPDSGTGDGPYRGHRSLEAVPRTRKLALLPRVLRPSALARILRPARPLRGTGACRRGREGRRLVRADSRPRFPTAERA